MRPSSCTAATKARYEDRYGGKGVLKAVQAVRSEIAEAVRGMAATDQVAPA